MSGINLDPYIFFQGNCKKAMEFYETIFGGELTIQKMDAYPDMPVDESMKDMVMHAMLEGDIRLMGSDSQKASPEAKKIELSLSGDDEAKLRAYWQSLGEGGKITMPLEKAPWGDTFGMLMDKYGIAWMININAKR